MIVAVPITLFHWSCFPTNFTLSYVKASVAPDWNAYPTVHIRYQPVILQKELPSATPRFPNASSIFPSSIAFFLPIRSAITPDGNSNKNPIAKVIASDKFLEEYKKEQNDKLIKEQKRKETPEFYFKKLIKSIWE